MKHFSISLNVRKLRPTGLHDFVDNFPRDGRLTLYALIVCFAAGIAGGALLIRANVDVAQTVTTWSAEYFARRLGGFWAVLCASAGCSAAFLFASFLVGMFIPGALFAPILAIVRGIGYGMLCGGLYRESVMSGILKNLVALFPSGGLGTLILLLALRESIGFSTSLLKTTVRGGDNTLSAGFKLYCTRYLILLGLLLLPALLDAFIAQMIW